MVDPLELSRQEFIQYAAEAIYIKDFDRRSMQIAIEKAIIQLFPSK